jgi:thiamine-phosphate diphosphorylase
MAARFRLVLISPDAHDSRNVARLERLLPGLADSVDALVLRWSGVGVRALIASARRLAAVNPRPPLLLRDRFDLAPAAGLEGVQLPEDGMLPAMVRSCWAEAMIGVSRHDAHGLGLRSEGADFALLSPVFESASKPGQRGIGLGSVAEMASACEADLIAMGGIDAARARLVVTAGAAGAGVRSAVFGSTDPVSAAASIRAVLDSAAAASPDH